MKLTIQRGLPGGLLAPCPLFLSLNSIGIIACILAFALLAGARVSEAQVVVHKWIETGEEYSAEADETARVFGDEAARQAFLAKDLLVIYTEQMEERLEEYEFAAREAWQLSDVVFRPAGKDGNLLDFDAAVLKRYNILDIQYDVIGYWSNDIFKQTRTAYRFSLNTFSALGDGMFIPVNIARMYLHPHYETRKLANLAEVKSAGRFSNLHPGTFKAWLTAASRALAENHPLVELSQFVVSSGERPALLTGLASDTLYIPRYAVTREFTGEQYKLKKLLKHYPYPFKVIDNLEFSDLLLDPKSPPFYWLDFNGGQGRYICVYRAPAQEKCYERSEPRTIGNSLPDRRTFRKLTKVVEAAP